MWGWVIQSDIAQKAEKEVSYSIWYSTGSVGELFNLVYHRNQVEVIYSVWYSTEGRSGGELFNLVQWRRRWVIQSGISQEAEVAVSYSIWYSTEGRGGVSYSIWYITEGRGGGDLFSLVQHRRQRWGELFNLVYHRRQRWRWVIQSGTAQKAEVEVIYSIWYSTEGRGGGELFNLVQHRRQRWRWFIQSGIAYKAEVEVCYSILQIPCNQACADMEFLPDTDILYIYNLKLDTRYWYRYLICHILKLSLKLKSKS